MNPYPKGHNRRSSKQRIENLNIEELSPLVVTMADQLTMAQLLQAPTEGYKDAIVVPAITADNFELKHGLITLVQNKQFFGHDKEDSHAHVRYFNKITSTLKYPNVSNTSIKLMLFPFSLEGAAQIWLEKKPPRSIFTWDDLVLKFIYQFFPPSKTTSLRNKITNFQQRFDEYFSEAWDRSKDLLRACPYHGNFLDKMPSECLAIIKSKSKVRYSRDKPVVAKVSMNASTSGVSPNVAELKVMVKALLLDKKSQNQSPAPVKAVEESCVTCGGAHSYRNCLATDGNNYRDNIQEFVSQAFAVNFNQGNTSYRPPMMSNQIRPPGFLPMPNNKNVQRNNQNHFIPNQNQGNNFNQGPVYQPPVFQPPAYQAPAYQALAPQIQGVSKEDFSAYVKANDAVMKNMQMQGQNNSGTLSNNTIANPKSDLKAITTRSGVSYDGSQIPPKVVENEPEVTKDIVNPTNNENTKDIQPQAVHFESPVLISKPVTSSISEPTIASIFKDMSFEISFDDALILMPKFASTLKALIGNKENLSEMARTPLNEHCSAVLLKKLSEKLGDPGKFLIPCDFPCLAECLALAVLGASINLMPFSVWKRLSLPDLTPTCITLELADHSISRPVGVAEDVYVKVGSFHFLADFVVVDFDADPRVPLILERSFLKTERALIDVFEGELTLRVGKEAITFNLDQTLRYSANYSDMTAKRIDVIDMACEEYSQKVLEVDAFLVVEDEPTSSEFHQCYLDPKGDILLLKAFLNDDPSLPPLNQRNYLPEIRKELKICEAKSDKSLVDEPPVVELKFYLPTSNMHSWKEKTTFTCPYETFAYRRMPFGLCNAPGTFQRCMMAIFHDMIEKTMEVFMDDFSVFGNSFQSCLSHLERMLKRCEDTNLCLNWEKSHFMVKEDSKARLLRWVLLLQEFTFKVIDTKGAENLAADHLSRLENPHQNVLDPKEINEYFPLETLNLSSEGVYLARKPLKSSRLATIDQQEVEAKALPRNDSRVVCKFLKNLFARFGAPNAIISNRGTHFSNDQFTKVMQKYGVTHRLATPYHPQISGQVEVSNRGLKRILERALGENRTSWSDKLDDALWAFRTAYKTLIGCTPYKLVYRKACHFPIELEHKAYWALKHANFDLKTACDHRKVQINELNELHDQAYENSLIYKEKTKRLHDSKIKNRVFNIDDRVLLFNSRLNIFSDRLKSRWSGPFTISQVYPYGTVELSQPDGPNFKVNGHRVKHYFGKDIPKLVVPNLQTFSKDH
uniref:Reverse transcriptase domain-containing protein n=1 Tax=Tanacetum cinerariifolium TaxID=118510 RepID=A0A6L2MZF0_TANCI|nr:reverse transcriptase domain-containing protein [Tanacetum cinerariifolium]